MDIYIPVYIHIYVNYICVQEQRGNLLGRLATGIRHMWSHDLQDTNKNSEQLLFGGIPVKQMKALISRSHQQLRLHRLQRQRFLPQRPQELAGGGKGGARLRRQSVDDTPMSVAEGQVFIPVYICVCVYVCVYFCVYVFVYACACACVCVCVTLPCLCLHHTLKSVVEMQVHVHLLCVRVCMCVNACVFRLDTDIPCLMPTGT